MVSARNMCSFLGRTTGAPKTETVGKNSLLKATICLAVDASKEHTDYLYMTAFGRQAEFCRKYLRKGQRILVTGHISGGNYTGKDGQTAYYQEIIIDEISFADNKKEECEIAERKEEPEDVSDKLTKEDFMDMSGTELGDDYPFD